jgi:hypothetical protein
MEMDLEIMEHESRHGKRAWKHKYEIDMEK